MPFTVLQTTAPAPSSTAATTATITPSSNLTRGSLLVLVTSNNWGALNSVSNVSDGTNTWQRAISTSDTGFVDSEIWYAYNNLLTTAPTITVTFVGSVNTALVLREYSGILATSDPKDQVIANTDNPGTLSHVSGNTPTTTQLEELVVTGLAWNNGTSTVGTPTTGYGNLTQIANATTGEEAAIADKLVSTTGAQSATWTTSATDRAGAMVVTFKTITPSAPAPLVLRPSGRNTGPRVFRRRTKRRAIRIDRFTPNILTKTQTATAKIAVSGLTKIQTATARIRIPVSTLTDDFNAGSIDTGKWTTNATNATVAQTGGVLHIVPSTTLTGYAGVTSVDKFSLAGSSIQIYMKRPTNAGIGNAEQWLSLYDDSNSDNAVRMDKGGDNLFFQIYNNGVADSTSVTWSSPSMDYWKIEESGGNLLFRTSPDATTWTTRRTVAVPAWSLDVLRVEIQAGTWAVTASAGWSDFDDLNILSNIVTKTQNATARIANVVTKTQPATARVAIVDTHTQSAIARVAKIVTKTQSAIARVETNPTKTQPAIARVATNRTKTQSAVSRIAKTVTKTQSGTAKIATTVTKTQTATASIIASIIWNGDFENRPAFTAAHTSTNNNFVNGTATGSAPDPGYHWRSGIFNSGAVQYDTAEFHGGAASYKLSTTGIGSYIEARYITGGYWGASGVKLLPNTTYRLAFWMKTNYVSGDAAAGARLTFIEADSTGANVSHETNSPYVQTTTGWTFYEFTFTTTATTAWGHPELRIYGHTNTGTLIMDAWFDDIQVGLPGSKTQTAVSRIAKTVTKTQTATARIAINPTKTQSATARIANVITKIQSAVARIANVITKTQSAIARVAKTVTKTQSATANIIQSVTVTKTQNGTARIANNLTKTQTGTARIAVIRTSGIRYVSYDATRITVFNHTAINNVGNNDSYTVLVRFRTTTKNVDHSVTEKWYDDGPSVINKYPWAVRGPNPSGNINFAIYDGTNNPGVTSSGVDTADGEWHTWVGVRDYGADQVRGYLDGSLGPTTTDTTTGDVSSDRQVTLGARSPGGQRWAGDLAEFILFDGVVSAGDITAFESGVLPSNTILARYNGTDASPTLWKDSSGNANNSISSNGVPGIQATQTAKARIANTRTATQNAISRIQKTLTKTQSATARIAKTVTKTQTATALVYATGRYWVGGTGSWTDTSHWATSPNGAGGVSVPTASDDVFLWSTGTVTLTNGAAMRSLNCAMFTGTLSQPGSVTINIGDGTAGYANVAIKLHSGMTGTLDVGANIINFLYTGSTPQSVDWGGKTPRTVNFGQASGGGSWRLDSGMTTSGGVVVALLSGKLDTNDQTISWGGGFNGSGAVVREVVLGSSAINLGGSWQMTTTTNLTFDAGTSSLTSLNGNSTFNSGGLTYYNASIGGSGGTNSLVGAATFNNLTFTGTSSGRVTIANNLVVNGTLTLASSSNTNMGLVQSSTRGTQRTITAATTAGTNHNLQDIVGAGTASWDFSAAYVGDMGGNSNITFPTPVTRYWVGTTGGSWANAAVWSASSGGASGATIPLCHDTAIFNSSSITSGSRTITVNQQCLPDLDFTGLTNSPTISQAITNGQLYVKGSLAYPASCTLSGTTAYNFEGRSAETITTNGKTVTNPIVVDCPGGSVTLADDFVGSNTFGVSFGTFDTDVHDFTCTAFSSNNSAVRTIDMGSGQWTLTGSGVTIWNLGVVTNLTMTRSVLPIKATYSGSTGTRTVAHLNTGESTCPSFWFSAGSDIVSFASTRVNDLDFTGFTGSLNPNTGLGVWGNLTMGTGMITTSSATTLNMYSTTAGDEYITSNGVVFNFPIDINGAGTTVVKLADDLTIASGRRLGITDGFFDANDFDITANNFASSNSNGRSVLMGNGTWTLTGTGLIWDCATTSNLTFNSEGSTIVVSDTGASSKSFSGLNLVYNDITIPAGGSGAIVFNNSCSIDTLTVAGPKTLTMVTGGTVAIRGNFDVNGSVGNLVTITSGTSGSQSTFTKSSGIVNVNYLSLKDSNATGGASWYAGPDSTNVSGNTGWIFTFPPITKTQSAVARIANNISVTQSATARIAKTIPGVQFGVARISNNLTKTQSATARVANSRTKTQSAISRVANGVTKPQAGVARITLTVTKTQSATARIANNPTKTQLAIARIAKNLTKTQSATAHIAPVVTKTQSATARIATTVTKTQTATAKIATTGTKTQSAISRIAKNLTKTQAAVARIANNVSKTQAATAHISPVVTRTQSGTARIQNIVTKTQSAVAKIATTVTKTQAGVARVAKNLTKTQSAVANIVNSFTKTQSAIARIAQVVTKTQTATAHIAPVVTKTQSAIARIATNRTKTQTATARIAKNLTKTQTAIARVSNSLTKTQTATAHITSTVTKTQSATAKIASTVTKTQTGTARITYGFEKMQSANARIANIVTKTQTATANIVVDVALTKTQNAIARIANVITKTQSATARVAKTVTKTQSAVGRIQNTVTKTQVAIARIATNKTKTQTAVARIANVRTKTQSGVSRIAVNFTKTQAATARIAKNLTKTQPATAKIIVSGVTKTQTATARIANVATKTQSATARIAISFTATQSAIARISNNRTVTQSAIARIANVGTKTQDATARIAKTVTKTQTATAAITQDGVVTKTQTATARIAKTVTKTQPAVARIANSFGAGFGFVQVAQAATTGASSLSIPIAATAQGNLLVVHIKGASGLPSIAITDNASVPNTYANTGSQISGGGGVVYQWYGVQVTGGTTSVQVSWTGSIAARITVQEFSGGQLSNAKVFDVAATGAGTGTSTSVPISPSKAGELIAAGGAYAGTQTAGAAGYVMDVQTSAFAMHKLSGTTSETAPVNSTSSTSWGEVVGAYLPLVEPGKTQLAIARIATNRIRTQSATARIVNTFTKTQTATAHIKSVVNKTQSATARIATGLTKTQIATARIVNSFTKTQLATARIARTVTKTQTAVARIVAGVTKTQPAVARIANTRTATTTATARLVISSVKTQTATARIAVTRTATQTATASIIGRVSRTQTARASIAVNFTKTQPATARLAEGGLIGVYTTTGWELKPILMWDGQQWVTKPLQMWDGTDWNNT